jgi:hypothetical protein
MRPDQLMVSASRVVGAPATFSNTLRDRHVGALCPSGRASEIFKQSGSGEAKKTGLLRASAFRVRSLSYGAQVARCSDALLASKTNRGLRQGS